MEEARGPFSVLFLFFLENVIIGREILKIEETIEKSWGKLWLRWWFWCEMALKFQQRN